MLSKKPVIASNHGGIIEIVINKETGLLFEPNNQIELKRAIETLINNRDLLISFGEKGEKRAKLKFSLEKYIEDFKVLYLNRSK
jgi:glycosyltransferase involved in cell wall biosynthesis